MSGGLLRIPFTEELLPKVQAFYCGAEPWELEVSNWIKAPRGANGAIDDLARNRIWLYMTQDGDPVGFGSLGDTMQKWPRSKDPPIPASIIPMLGIDRKYHGQPPGPPDNRYSSVIMDDLITEAAKQQSERSILVLYVDARNERAIHFYERFSFTELHKPWKDPKTASVYKRMVLSLR